MNESFAKIETAELDWQNIDGVEIPISRQFGDVYFSKANGLLETRHVFLNGNDLPERLAQLEDHQYFAVGETGFGTGLNFLALWQLWQQVRPNNHSHLHFVSVEKYPLSLPDLKRALQVWDELKPLADQLIQHYPLALAGCHRIIFAKERISLDLWFGDAAQCFPLMQSQQPIHAWFLDGFAPSCNPELWQEHIFQHIMRLSSIGTTFASFSVAGILKRALTAYGVQIQRPKGFGHKREMLKAIWLDHETATTSQNSATITTKAKHVAIIGAGIAGLNCAWSLAQRGISVTIFDQNQPLSGSSGNPLAMLNPKLCPIEQAATHLMTTSWQYALHFYSQFSAFQPLKIYQQYDKNIQQIHNIMRDYPSDIVTEQINHQNETITYLLKLAGTIAPHQFAQQILAHPLIQFKTSEIRQIHAVDDHVIVIDDHQQQYSHVIVCNALAINTLFPKTAKLKAIRGQISWTNFDIRSTFENMNTGFSYGGYAMPLQHNQLIFGASFHPNNQQTDININDHQHNAELMQKYLPKLAQHLPDIQQWHGRASLRAQTPDYLPLVGQIDTQYHHIFCLAGLGSKGFLFAPLCSEIITAQILNEILPVPNTLLKCLQPTRFNKKIKTPKPYYKNC